MSAMEIESTMTPLLSHLIKRPCMDIRPRAKNRTNTVSEFTGAICVKDNQTLPYLYKQLHDNNIMACPVISSVSNCYLGVASFPMLVHWIIDNFDTHWGRPTGSSPSQTWNSDFTKEQKWQETTVMTLLQSQFQYDAPAVSRENSLFFAFELLARTNRKMCAIVSPSDQHVTGVFTQSMALGEIYNKMMDGTISKKAKEMKVRDLNASWFVASVRERQLAITAFRLMKEKKYSGVAIVDAAGKLTDVLSTRDMKGIANGSILFSRLYLTVKNYKEKVRAEHTPKRGRQIVNTAKWATRDTSMFEVVKQMDEHNLHRIVIVDSATSMIPIQMLSIVDIMQTMLPSPQAYSA